MATAEQMAQMPWITWLDLDTEVGPGGALAVVLRRPKPEHLNHNNHVNAPVVYGVAEVAGAGAAVLAAGSSGAGAYTVIRNASIEYRRPARAGITAIGNLDPETARQMRLELHAGRGYDASVHVTLTDADGTPTGTCDFTVSLRPNRVNQPEH